MFSVLIVVGFVWVIFAYIFFSCEPIWSKKRVIILLSAIGVLLMYLLMYLTYHWEVKERYTIVSVEGASLPLGNSQGELRHIVKTTNGVFVIDPYYARYEFNGEGVLEMYEAKSLFMKTGDYKYLIKN